MKAGDRNSISNKILHSQCPSITDLLTRLATTDWTSQSRLFTVSNQWRADDELDGASGHCGFVLEGEEKRETTDGEKRGRQGIHVRMARTTKERDFRHIKHHLKDSTSTQCTQ